MKFGIYFLQKIYLNLLFDDDTKSFVVCVIFTLSFHSPTECFITVPYIGLVKKVALYMSWFFDDLRKLFAY